MSTRSRCDQMSPDNPYRRHMSPFLHTSIGGGGPWCITSYEVKVMK